MTAPKRAPTEREQFEAAMERYFPGFDYTRHQDEGYISSWIDGAWMGWKLARRRGKG